MLPSDLWHLLFCRPSLEQGLAEAGPVVRAALGVGAVVVQSLDLERRVLSTVAEDRRPGFQVVPPARQQLSDQQLRAVLAWVREGKVGRGRPSDDPLLGQLVGPESAVELIAGPLQDDEHGPLGVLLLLAEPEAVMAPLEVEASALLEPFAIALGAHRRVQELGRLREVVEADNRALLSRLERQRIVESIVGGEAGFKGVMDRVGQVAPTDVPVLLLGETGTGKEVVARAIHDQSARHSGPMHRVNCGAIPPGLVDSELFGHERGSFTGAVAARTGWFERADGGTLFLDEVGELPLAAQVRLLRVLQEAIIERVGGQRSVHVDVRIVAATHRDLEQMVEQGGFRQDLFYRISVFPIAIPPLRERREDLPALASHFGWSAGRRIGGRPLGLSPGDVDLLLAYDWPGNVRELASVIERAAILGDGKYLDIAGALGSRADRGRRDSAPASASVAPGDFAKLDTVITRHIEAALGRTRGKIEGPGGAAELLGLNPHTLRSKMRRLGIQWRRFRS